MVAATPAPGGRADLNNLAVLLQDTNLLAEAEPLMRRALAIGEASCRSSERGDRPHDLASLLHASNRQVEAEPGIGRAVVIYLTFERQTGHTHPNRDNAVSLVSTHTDRGGPRRSHGPRGDRVRPTRGRPGLRGSEQAVRRTPPCLCGKKFFRFQQHEPNRQASPARIQESLLAAPNGGSAETYCYLSCGVSLTRDTI